MSTLTKEREAQIRETVATASTSLEDGYADLNALLAELDRIRPQWVPLSEGSHEYNHLYQVAGIPTEGKPPRHVGRGRYIEAAKMWFDEDTNRPFTYPITHYGRQLPITEIIGQPRL